METNKEGNIGATSADAGKISDTATEQATRIADLETRLAKETKDKEIYRAGLLSAKDLGKRTKRIAPEDLEDPEKLEAAIEAKFQDKELEQKALQEVEQSVSRDEALKKENEELRRSLEAAKTAGYGGSASMGSGHNERSETTSTGYWSDAQRNELRQIYNSRGIYSGEQVEKMVKKAEEIAVLKTAQSARSNDITKTRPY